MKPCPPARNIRNRCIRDMEILSDRQEFFTGRTTLADGTNDFISQFSGRTFDSMMIRRTANEVSFAILRERDIFQINKSSIPFAPFPMIHLMTFGTGAKKGTGN